MLTKFFEFKSQDVHMIMNTLSDYFTIGFEIEIQTDQQRIKKLPDVRNQRRFLKESHPIVTPSRTQENTIEDFKEHFDIFYEHWSEVIEFHEDESITRTAAGLEIVSKPFTNIKTAISFIKDFFGDYDEQKDWFFSPDTSVHINIGTKEKKNWNLIKGILMLADVNMKQPIELRGWEEYQSPYVFKGIESREDSEWCRSLKLQILSNPITEFNIKSYETIINSNNQKELENVFLSFLKELFDEPSAEITTNKKYGVNLSRFIFKNIVERIQAKGNQYIEFRYIGGDNIDENLIIDKLKYFSYITYLMTSDHNEREYLRKLFSFKERIRERFERDIKKFRKENPNLP